jgi:hydrogenase nickel incorporation protein HypA/HybF
MESRPMLYPMEIGIAQRILAIVQEEMARYKVSSLKTIRLVVGEAVPVNPQRLTSCFELVSQATPQEGAKLELELDPLACRCIICAKIFFIEDEKYLCPNCHSNQIEIISGGKFLIKEIVAG